MNTKAVVKIIIVAIVFTLASLSFYLFSENSRILFANELDPNEKPLRLHVLANSDSAYDQQLKLDLRDYMIEMLDPHLAEANNKENAMQVVADKMPQLSVAANEFLANRSPYTATLALEQTDFPAIDYDGLVFAAGEYDALRIIIGSGDGKNWWCVLFPPLCFVDLATEYSEDEAMEVWSSYSGDDENKIKVRWKLIDLFK